MIRKYQPTDLEKILEIWYESSTTAHPFLDDEFVEMIQKAMRENYIPKSQTWVFIDKEIPVGFISMNGNEIGGLFLLPYYFGRGIGTKLVNYILDKFTSLEVEVFEENNIGKSFYFKFGFSLIKKYNHEESGQIVLRLGYSKQGNHKQSK